MPARTIEKAGSSDLLCGGTATTLRTERGSRATNSLSIIFAFKHFLCAFARIRNERPKIHAKALRKMGGAKEEQYPLVQDFKLTLSKRHPMIDS
jgi:hypothetical protein